MIRPALALGVLAALAPALGAQELRVVAQDDLGGEGLNGPVAVVGTTAVVGYGIHPGLGVHAHLYNPYPCPAGAVKVVDLADPERPRVAGRIPVPEGVAAIDVAARHVETEAFRGNLAAVALARCGMAGDTVHRGVAYWDVSDPSNPTPLGRYHADEDLEHPPDTPPCGPAPDGSGARCASSQYSVRLVVRRDGRVLSLSTEPGASASEFPSGDLRVVDVTDPRAPRQVGSFPPPGRDIFSVNGCRPFSAGRAVGADPSGELVALGYYDDGILLLDLDEPASPTVRGRWAYPPRRDVEGNAAWVGLTEVDGRTLALVSEEDWIAPTTTVALAGHPGAARGCSAMFTLFDPAGEAPVHRHDDRHLEAEMVYAGRGCPADPAPHMGTPMETDGPDPYLAPVRDRIVLLDRTRQPTQPDLNPGAGCSVAERAGRARDEGAVAVVLAQTVEATPQAFSPDGDPSALGIPVIHVDRDDGDRLREALCPERTEGRCAGGGVHAVLADGRGAWGALRVLDVTDPGSPEEVAALRSPRAEVFPPPGLGVHAPGRIEVDGARAYVAWHASGVRVLALDGDVPREIAHFVPPARPDPTGVLPSEPFVVGVAALPGEAGEGDEADTRSRRIVITDVHSGLWVLEVERDGSLTPASGRASAPAGRPARR